MSIDYNSRAYLDFKAEEQKKYPAFGKYFWDDKGTISGTGHFRQWKWQAQQYLNDRSLFIQRLRAVAETAVEKPSIQRTTSNSVEAKTSNLPGAKRRRRKKVKVKTTKSGGDPPLDMPGPTKRSIAWRKKKGGRRKRRTPPQLRSIRIPFKTVMDVNSKTSSAETGFFFNHLTLKELAPTVLSVYEEFKVCGMRVRYIPQDVTSGAGLYAAVLLDQHGFGDPAKGPSTWFSRVADLPGSRMCNVSRGCSFSWKPTEPDAKNYRKCHEAGENGVDYQVATFYIFAQSSDKNLTGKLLITGSVRVRGEYYSASICDRLTRLNLEDSKEIDGDESDDSASIVG